MIYAMLLLAGCATPKPRPVGVPPPPVRAPSKPSVMLDFRPVGLVAMVNSQARFVVLTFPPGAVPQPGRRLNVNHQGMKIGEVKVTGPQRDTDTVADVVTGDAYVGDEVKGE